MNQSFEAAVAQAGDLIQLAGPRQKNFIFRLKPGDRLETHRGIVYHDDLIGKPLGIQVFSHLGRSFLLLEPSLSDVLKETRRSTQIMYPKDIGYILVTMGIGAGKRVLEAGTGSGALTTALAFSVGTEGKVYSYEAREQMQRLAIKNLERLGFADRVEFKLRNAADGFDERNVDALFLDLPNPYDYLPQVRAALKPGGYFGTILPTMNQVQKLLNALYHEDFSFVDVCEIFLRYYQAVADKLRPTDRMVAHTGYLIFARPVTITEDKEEWLEKQARTRAGQGGIEGVVSDELDDNAPDEAISPEGDE